MVSRTFRHFVESVEDALEALDSVREELTFHGDVDTLSDSDEYVEALEEIRAWGDNMFSAYRKIEGKKKKGRRR